jgi:eukaryotic-like serine/threonine-protein kinase
MYCTLGRVTCPLETQLLDFAEGNLDDSARAEICAHLDTCAECRTLVLVSQGFAGSAPAAGENGLIGRYVLRRILGQGGMGIVFEAYDPSLDRIVALKLLHPSANSRSLQERLRQEALAMAKLSHANVVTVHDVGEASGQTYIVMACVRGVSLRSWLYQQKPTIEKVVDVFVQAGEGLAAAHHRGLTHRDFKPDNVLMQGEQALVTDFGLAITDAEHSGSIDEGTLAYMAPEQREGLRVDHRSDQYSYGVALREACAIAILAAEEDGGRIPRWLARVIATASQNDAERRYPSMRALLDAIAQAQRRQILLKRAGASAILLSALGLALFGIVRFNLARRAPVAAPIVCTEDIPSIWNPAMASEVEQSMKATQSPIAGAAFLTVKNELDAYTQRWGSAASRVCAGAESGVANSARARQLHCLTDRLDHVRAITQIFKRTDAQSLENAGAVLALLPAIETCEDPNAMALLPNPPKAETAVAVAAARKRLAEAATTIAAGHYERGLALTQEVARDAEATHDFPLIAETELWVGTAQGRLGKTDESEATLTRAVASASAGDARIVAVRAWIALMHFLGVEGKRPSDGRRYNDYAKAALLALPGQTELEAERRTWYRAVVYDEGKIAEAFAASQDETAFIRTTLGENHRLLAAALDGRATVLRAMCRTRDALEPQQQGCALLEKRVGSTHPQVALCLGNLASLHAGLGEHSTALTLKQRALLLFQALPGHPNHIAMAHRNLVRSMLELGQLDAAQTELALAEKDARSSDRPVLGMLTGDLRRRQHKYAEATKVLTETLEQSKDPGRRIEVMLLLAQTASAAGERESARQWLRKLAPVVDATYAKDCRAGVPLATMADVYATIGELTEAQNVSAAALSCWGSAQVDEAVRARTEALAHAP